MDAATIDAGAGDDVLAGTLDAAQTSVLRMVCALGAANAALMLVLTVAAGRPPLAVCVTVAWVAAWWWSRRRASWLTLQIARRPAVLVLAGAIGMVPVALGAGLHGTLTTQGLWLTWVAAVTVGATATMVVAASLSVATLVALMGAGMSVGALLDGPDRFQATLLILNPVCAALMALALVGVFRRSLRGAGVALDAIRAGGEASTPAMSRLLHGRIPALLKAPAVESLTDAEREVVGLLREGLAPKQIAQRRASSVATVRTQIKRAKRKTGARTLNDLIRLTWPQT